MSEAWKSFLVVVGAMLGVTAVGFVIVVLASGAMEDDRQDQCSAVQATPVATGNGRFLCVTPDGRVVGHG